MVSHRSSSNETWSRSWASSPCGLQHERKTIADIVLHQPRFHRIQVDDADGKARIVVDHDVVDLWVAVDRTFAQPTAAQASCSTGAHSRRWATNAMP